MSTTLNFNDGRKRLDKLYDKGYNISKISIYAIDRYEQKEYAETYTEYRVKTMLEG